MRWLLLAFTFTACGYSARQASLPEVEQARLCKAISVEYRVRIDHGVTWAEMSEAKVEHDRDWERFGCEALLERSEPCG